ncbi:ComEC/Rec2 family competence protein [Natronorubrum daqingense]|uniref:Competence protein ComEC n=1 Tax=Natronorubrum daqingense TaxID=588898 RepID=A0A1N7C971_9EURY|nr:MBL fold metallo-hydrolase [Natronorubrum daqingense]APX96795.1 MBL fold metallo-hydrolase [Natronorubrum daqingense]SIR60033.1 competence protein ComEC [Natronorubrum daqingense]
MSRGRVLLIVSVGALVVLSGCLGGFEAGSERDETEPELEGELEIHHIDVGQADSTLLETPANETILIDTGDWRQDGDGVIEYLDEENIDRIDHLVATHAHADHIGGHAAVIEHVEEHGDGVGAAYDSGVAHSSATYDDYLDAVEAYDVQLFEVSEGHTLGLEGEALEATVLNPPEERSGDDLHYNSIALHVEFDEFEYLTTGDAEDDAEERMIDEHGDSLDADAYQAGHHGSSTSSTEAFLDGVDPDVAVVSSDLESQYGHPHDEVLESFADRGIETYWTGVHGDIVVASEGDDASLSTSAEHNESTDPAVLLDLKHDAVESSDSLQPISSISDQSTAIESDQPSAVESSPLVDGAVAPTIAP